MNMSCASTLVCEMQVSIIYQDFSYATESLVMGTQIIFDNVALLLLVTYSVMLREQHIGLVVGKGGQCTSS